MLRDDGIRLFPAVLVYHLMWHRWEIGRRTSNWCLRGKHEEPKTATPRD